MGYADAAERAQIIANEAAMLVAGAVRQGRNPATVAHELSEQWGYTPAAAASADTSSRGAGAVRQCGGSNPRLAAQKGCVVSFTLQAIASRPADGPLTLEDIAEMDDEAYERYVEKNGGDLAALLRSTR